MDWLGEGGYVDEEPIRAADVPGAVGAASADGFAVEIEVQLFWAVGAGEFVDLGLEAVGEGFGEEAGVGEEMIDGVEGAGDSVGEFFG